TNVISVTTAQTDQTTSIISYYGDVSYTTRRLSKILEIPLVKVTSPGLSDITIQIGKDKGESVQ
ncbi:MAG: hypothetical protein ACREGI_00425, partial [Candidatus Levyibacteriota bacterium]